MPSIRARLTILAASVLCTVAAMPVSASTIGFEGLAGADMATSFTALGIGNTYLGNVWSASGGDWGVCDANCFGDQSLRAHSGSAYAWSYSGPQSLTIQFAGATRFTGGYFAGQFLNRGGFNASTIELLGYDASNALVGSTAAIAIGDSSWRFIAADFSNVSRLDIRSDRAGSWFAVDDLQVGATSVPEPASVALFGLGLLGAAAARRKPA